MSGGIIYQADIEKAVGIETWTNVYYLHASGRVDAETKAGQIAVVEQGIHSTDVTFTRTRVRQVSAAASGGSQTVLGFQGAVGGSPNFPLFVCTRVLFQQQASRPSVKYLRGCVDASRVGNRFEFTQLHVTFIQTNYSDELATLGFLCSRDGAGFDGIECQVKMAEHQLRRGSKRKLTPVLG